MKYFTVAGEDRTLDGITRRQLRGSYIDLTDGVTHYELRGPTNGPVVVLVPGLTIPLFYWDSVAAELHSRGLRTLAFSAYGRGYSERVRTDYTEALFSRQLRELVAELQLPTHHLVGTSMGALIAMGYVAAEADSVASLTLVGPAGLSGANTRQQRLLRSDLLATLVAKRSGRRILLGHLEHNVADPALVPQLKTMISDAYRYEGSMYAFFSTLQNFPLSSRGLLFRGVGERKVPTQLLWGTNDQVTPITGLDDARALLQPAETHLLQCGHMAPYERPLDVAEHLVSFTTAHHDRITS
ncbi:alpha/beta fold hydrolase [Mycobacterium sp. pW049]|uniref:alpha/beta fold hydrolase n=1 Tax=[Mycobacterium] bulgaricum TaxID=3238985 RepID=UPI00351BBA26